MYEKLDIFLGVVSFLGVVLLLTYMCAGIPSPFAPMLALTYIVLLKDHFKLDL